MAEQLLPQVFRKDPPYLISFNYSDTLRGTSYLKLYCSAAFPKATIYESLTATDDTDATFNVDATLFCQTFTVGTTGTNEAFWVNGIEFYGRGQGIMMAYIKAVDGDGKPTGNKLAFGKVLFTSANNAWHRISFALSTKLSASTKYALVLERDNTVMYWRYDGSALTYTGGSYGTSADSGATWTMDTAKDFLFKILGDTRPSLTFFSEDMDNATSYQIINVGPAAYTQQFTTDIDMIIGKSAILKGTAIVNAPITLDIGTNTSLSVYYTIELLKVSGTTETSIGSAVTMAPTITANGTTNLLTQVYLNNNVNFGVTDTLKLRLAFYLKAEDATATADITFEPKDIWINLPFKIN